LIVTDGYSRLILACEAVPRPTAEDVVPILTRLFQSHGLPRALRTDSGSPFSSRRGLAGLSRLSVWLLKLEVWPDCIGPGRPDQNGRHERLHRVLGEDTARPPAATVAAQPTLDAWRQVHNTQPPHEGPGQQCPASLYVRLPCGYPAAIADWDYPADNHVRRMDRKDCISWRDCVVYATEALRGEAVALAQRDDGDWRVRFHGFDLAVRSDALNAIVLTGLSRSADIPSPRP
jgi:hypothetical protein